MTALRPNIGHRCIAADSPNADIGTIGLKGGQQRKQCVAIFSRHGVDYCAAFGGNDYHFTKARIALLLLAHANKPFQANRYDYFLNQDRRKLRSGRRFRFAGNRKPIFARRMIEMPKMKVVPRWASTDDWPFDYGQIWSQHKDLREHL
jgi:hypothetical protein